MNGKIIKDIRVYKSDKQNEYGIPSLHSFGDKKLNLLKYMHLYYIIKNKGKEDDYEFLGL